MRSFLKRFMVLIPVLVLYCTQNAPVISSEFNGKWICTFPGSSLSMFDTLVLQSDCRFFRSEKTVFHATDTVPYEMMYWGSYVLVSDTIEYIIDSLKTCADCGRYDLTHEFSTLRNAWIRSISNDSMQTMPFSRDQFKDMVFGYRRE